MELTIEIIDRTRKYGYIFWKKTKDNEVKAFFGNIHKVSVGFENSFLVEKIIDFDHRRFSIGWKNTRALSKSKTKFILSFDDDKKLRILCR